MDDDATPPLSPRARLVSERFGQWLRPVATRLYRHDLALDTDALARAVAVRFEEVLGEAEEKEDPLLRDPVSFCQSVLGGSTVELLRSAQAGQINGIATAAATAEPAPSQEIVQTLERVVATLPDEHQMVAMLQLQGFSRQEIENLTGWSDDEARQRLHEAEKGLREWLQAAGVEYAAD